MPRILCFIPHGCVQRVSLNDCRSTVEVRFETGLPLRRLQCSKQRGCRVDAVAENSINVTTTGRMRLWVPGAIGS